MCVCIHTVFVGCVEFVVLLLFTCLPGPPTHCLHMWYIFGYVGVLPDHVVDRPRTFCVVWAINVCFLAWWVHCTCVWLIGGSSLPLTPIYFGNYYNIDTTQSMNLYLSYYVPQPFSQFTEIYWTCVPIDGMPHRIMSPLFELSNLCVCMTSK